ncbi:GNAT family N-acetyltransferase [Actinomadura harenae]|uniref:N-acetyltransferase n=1 Tax=Actinomadura harenae TaxID=2483351 RepID=A0A3M2MEE7_9ACTN|nr:GNAT family N-acetyltransferase [Actinomadura harenae]RMI47869.1 N-acetyltransferase [Actinomadura harenae]
MLTFPITTRRLVLRVPQADDLDHLRDLYEDPIALEHVGTQANWNRDLTADRLDRWADQHRRLGYSMATVVRRSDGRIVGLSGMTPNEDGDPELSGLMIRQWWGENYGLEATEALLGAVQDDPRFPIIMVRMETTHPAIDHVERTLLIPNGFTFVRVSPLFEDGKLMRLYQWTSAQPD